MNVTSDDIIAIVDEENTGHMHHYKKKPTDWKKKMADCSIFISGYVCVRLSWNHDTHRLWIRKF